MERSDIEADFATGVGLETLSHNHNDGDDDDDDGDGDVQWARHLVGHQWWHNLNDDGDDDDQWVSSITSSGEKTRTNEKFVENQPEVKSGKRGRLSQGSALHCSPWSYNSL